MKLRSSLRRKLTLLFLATGSLLTACQDEAENPAPDAKTQLLTTEGPWHITAYTRTTGSGAAANYLNLIFPDACERDDRYTFKTTGVEERTEGPTACTGNAATTVVGTYPWNFNSAQTQLTIGSITFDIVQLTATAIQLRWTRTSNGVTLVDNVTYAN
jgi:hypothetical protein